LLFGGCGSFQCLVRNIESKDDLLIRLKFTAHGAVCPRESYSCPACRNNRIPRPSFDLNQNSQFKNLSYTLTTTDEARRIAANIAKLQELVRKA